MEQTLVVVDMQPEFLQRIPAADQVVAGCLGAIQRAAPNPVVFLEIRNRCLCPTCVLGGVCGNMLVSPTLPELMGAAPNHYLRVKRSNDGSPLVQEVVALHKLPPRFLVMGVNTSACVLDTVLGLRQVYPLDPIQVLSSGCGASSGHQWGLDRIAEALGEGAIL